MNKATDPIDRQIDKTYDYRTLVFFRLQFPMDSASILAYRNHLGGRFPDQGPGMVYWIDNSVASSISTPPFTYLSMHEMADR